MSIAIWEVLFILLLIIANGIFSGSEIAIVSSRRARLEQLAKKGDKDAKLALGLANSPNDFLSTVQIGITLIGILSGALGGATVATRLQGVLAGIPFINNYSEALSLGIVVTMITYLSLVIGELLPKRLALNNPEKIACAVASPMRFLSMITAPFVHFLGVSTELMLKLLAVKASEEPPVTEEEIKVMIDMGTQAGMFEEAEQDMVSRVFRLGDRPIKALMTPRTEIVWLDADTPIAENLQQVQESSYSRFPVGKGTLDNCLGIVRVKNLLSAKLGGVGINLETILQTPLYVPENSRALKVLELFKQSGTHIALVTDEYGGVEGLVTLNDLLEALVGELPEAEDRDDPMSVKREDGSWLLDGLMSIDELKDLFDKESLPDEEQEDYHTLAGFVIASLGHIPAAAEYFEWGGLKFEVVDMDGIRVDKVLVTPQTKSEDVLPDGKKYSDNSFD